MKLQFDTELFFSLPHYVGDYWNQKETAFCAFGAFQKVGKTTVTGLPPYLDQIVIHMNDGDVCIEHWCKELQNKTIRFDKAGPQPYKARILLYKLLKKYDLIEEITEHIPLPKEKCLVYCSL